MLRIPDCGNLRQWAQPEVRLETPSSISHATNIIHFQGIYFHTVAGTRLVF